MWLLWNVFVLALVVTVGSGQEVDPFVNAVVNSSTIIGIDVLRLSPNVSNTLMSPLGLSQVLTMVYLGTGGDTKTHLGWALGYDYMTEKQIVQAFSDINTNLSMYGKTQELAILNGVFVQSSFPIRQSFNNILQGGFNATVQSVDFASNPNSTKKTIEDWIETATSDLIDETDIKIDANTQALLISGMYFKGRWQNAFPTKNTKSAQFRNADGTSTSVKLMTVSGNFSAGYSSELDSQIVKLPYDNGQVAMFVFLPAKSDGIFQLIDRLSLPALEEAVGNLTLRQNYRVFLPKFDVEVSSDLKDILLQLGFDVMFEDNANFSAMTNVTGLKVSDVQQKVTLDVDEEGSEAASVTTATLVLGSSPGSSSTFVADRPFFFSISHLPTNSYLLFGKILNANHFDD